MHAQVLVGMVLALACSAGASLGGLWKMKGAVAARDVDIRHPLKSAVALFRSKWFVFFDLEVTRRQWVGLGLLGLGMVVLGVTAHGDRNHASYGALPVLAFELGALALGAGFILGCRSGRGSSSESRTSRSRP